MISPATRSLPAEPAKETGLYLFAPMTREDLRMLRRWLATPQGVRWWGDAEEQFDLVRGDLDEPAMAQFIVSRGNSPFAYLQCHDVTAWPEPAFGPQPDGTRGIDQFIGEPDMQWSGFDIRGPPGRGARRECQIQNFTRNLYLLVVHRF